MFIIVSDDLYMGVLHTIHKYYGHLSDCLSGYVRTRWIISLALIACYFYQAYASSYGIITYIIGFYLLQLGVAYFTPRGLEEEEQVNFVYDHIHQQFIETEYIDHAETPLKAQSSSQQSQQQQQSTEDQLKPLVGTVGQFYVWVRTTIIFCIGLICTQFKELQVDVFWPILMAYFVCLVFHTFYKIIRKMQKYKYSFSDFSKKFITQQTFV